MLDPMPLIRAPIVTSIRHRSWMCGSEAAFSMVVLPFHVIVIRADEDDYGSLYNQEYADSE